MKCGARMIFLRLLFHGKWINKTVFDIIMSKRKEEVFYAVGVGSQVGVYKTWNECKKHVEGVANPKFRKFNNLEEAENFVENWKKKSQCNSSDQPSTSFDLKNNDMSQAEPYKQKSKGDEKLREEASEQKNNAHEFNQYVDTQFAQNFGYQYIKKHDRNKFKNKHQRNKTNINNFRENQSHFVSLQSKDIKKKERHEVSKKGVPKWSAFHSLSQDKTNGGSKNMYQTWDTNFIENQSQIANSLSLHSNLNYTGLVYGSQTSLFENQTRQSNIPSHMDYSTCTVMGKTNSSDLLSVSFLQRPYTSPLQTCQNFVTRNRNSEVSGAHAMFLPEVSSNFTQGLSKNVSDCNSDSKYSQNVKAQHPVCKSNKNMESASIPSKCNNQAPMEEVQNWSKSNEPNKCSRECDIVCSSETKDSSRTSCVDETTSKPKTVQENIGETLKKIVSVNDFNVENNLVVTSGTLQKLVDIMWGLLKGKIPGNAPVFGDGPHQSKSNDFSKTNIAESQESRSTCSFSGEWEDNVASDVTTGSPVKQIAEYSPAELIEKVATCERKVDMGIGKVGEFLTFLMDVKNELVQLKQLIPQNFVQIAKEIEFPSKSPLSGTSCSAFLKDNICKNETGDDENCKSQRWSSERLQRIEKKVDFDDNAEILPPLAKRRRDDISPSNSHENKLDRDIKQERADASVSYVPFATDENEFVIVYTDGSCFHNGTDNAKAGIGIWFDEEHPMNVSQPLNGAEPTNNNAEIQAARIACELALNAGVTKLKICTDSEFLINCATKWVHKWKRNGWVTESKKPVKNRAELEKLMAVSSRLVLRWEKVPGHTNIRGNEMADRLANSGAELYVRRSY